MRCVPWFAALLAFGLGLSSRAAWADEPGQDEVTLKGGGSIRGTVLVVEPGKSVEIAVAGEPQPRVVPWSDVDQVQKGKFAPPPAAPAAPPPPPPPAAPPLPPAPKLGDPGVVRVHLDSPVRATLVHEYDAAVPITEAWVDRFGNTVTRDAAATVTQKDKLCGAPCDQVMRDDLDLRIVGPFPSSPLFSLAGKTGDVTVQVNPGSKGLYGGGVAAIVLGITAAVAGAVVLPVNQAASTTTDLNTGAKVHVPNPGLGGAGIGLVAGGLVALGGGIAMVVLGGTKVTVTQAGAARTAARPRYWMGEL
jgi:hypothetical protein